ncbi:hypothetical protein DNTS_010290 [Danionella cerebrum]|uniref:C2H2-type domain-containing protein n=1 Tax=Danionella cerebrum TaxID=2873325 RepID=A0A553MRB4_9TELE|nr:hypothetical protein DNTS_010290 [Danionella translucida]
MAASIVRKNSRHKRQQCSDKPLLQDREIVVPSISELTKEVRTNILCTVQGCGKILPNSPALNMHLVKSHRVQEGLVNPTCSNGYSTEWDLRRHAEDCGRTYSCTCGCPYASRAALLSHVYRTGHEVPTEHRYPPVKKRKMEQSFPSSSSAEEQIDVTLDSKKSTEGVGPALLVSEVPDGSNHSRNAKKLLLPKPKVALVNVPIMHFAPLPVLLPSSQSSALRSVVLSLDAQGSVSTVHFLSPIPDLNKLLKESPSGSEVIQVRLESQAKNCETDRSVSKAMSISLSDGAVSSCSQTDISVSAQVQLPVSVQTQTVPCRIKSTFSTGAQTELFSSSFVNETRKAQSSIETQMDHEVGSTIFDAEVLSVSTQTAVLDAPFRSGSLEDPLRIQEPVLFEDKTSSSMCFGAQTEHNTVADNQTQTMILFQDLENILSEAGSSCSSGLVPAHEPPPSTIDFDFEEFLNATHIQTQTEESGLNPLNTEPPLELLDIETQTDFLLFENLSSGQSRAAGARVQPNDLELEMFDTQTQTDLNFLLDSSGHLPLGSILRQSSFSMSTESSDTETQTDLRPAPLSLPSLQEAQVRLSSAETQTPSSCVHSLGHLFLTSNETQTAVDDFLSADPAWNIESHFSSVETQTCEELLSLFRHTEKAKT